MRADQPRMVQIVADDGPWWGIREDGVIVVAKRAAPESLCDWRDRPGCGGPLYRWTQENTTLAYWPVIRCENHLRLQTLHQAYCEEWRATRDWLQRMIEDRLYFDDWLKEHWADDTSAAKVGPYWESVNGRF